MTRIKLKHLSDKEIKYYVSTEEGIGKASGCNIEGTLDCFVKKIIGSYSNIIGLPMCDVINSLQSFGIKYC